METKPFVSVVLPTYNRKEALKECLDSLFNQTYPSKQYEVIIANDGSTDGTEELLRTYAIKNPNLRYFTQSNKGCSSARNLGTKKSRGQILCFTDDDCIADKNWIKNLVEKYSADDVGGVGGRIIEYSREKIIERYIKKRKLLDQEKFFSPCVTANTSYRKNAIEKVGYLDESFAICGDVDLGIRVRLQGFKFEYAPEAIIYHRHRTTLKGLIKQQYGYSREYAMLHTKYTQDYDPSYNMILLPIKITYTVVTYPLNLLRIIFVKDKKYHVFEPLIDIVVSTTHFFGMFKEVFFGKDYGGDKYTEKVEFLDKQSINDILKMVWSKINIFKK